MTDDLTERVARVIGLSLRAVVEEDCRASELTEEELAEAATAALAVALEEAAKVADGFRCGLCGMDGQAAAAIRALIKREGP